MIFRISDPLIPKITIHRNSGFNGSLKSEIPNLDDGSHQLASVDGTNFLLTTSTYLIFQLQILGSPHLFQLEPYINLPKASNEPTTTLDDSIEVSSITSSSSSVLSNKSDSNSLIKSTTSSNLPSPSGSTNQRTTSTGGGICSALLEVIEKLRDEEESQQTPSDNCVDQITDDNDDDSDKKLKKIFKNNIRANKTKHQTAVARKKLKNQMKKQVNTANEMEKSNFVPVAFN